MLLLDDRLIVDAYRRGATESALAVIFAVGRSTIHRRLVAANVQTRTAQEVTDRRRFRHFAPTFTCSAIIDGLLLGDASIEAPTTSESRLELTQRREGVDWLRSLQTVFALSDVDCRIADRGARGVQLRTRKYVTFTSERERWYPAGRKRVPQDLCLAPPSLAQWYWGDGSTNNNGYRMTFCTDAFDPEDVRRLATRLSTEYGWQPTLHAHQGRPRISISKRNDRQDFAARIRPYCPPCFVYKLDVRA